MKTLNQLWQNSVSKYGELPALCNRKSATQELESGGLTEIVEYEKLTYNNVEEMVVHLGSGLIELGLNEKDSVALIAENSYKWMVCDLAILGNHAQDVPRGTKLSLEELVYIINHADVKFAIVENEAELLKILSVKDKFPQIRSIVVLEDSYKCVEEDLKILSFSELMEIGKRTLAKNSKIFQKRRNQAESFDVATLMYTSGTEGVPKGIPLTHGNIMHVVNNLPDRVKLSCKDKFMSILPSWHIFERTVEYYCLAYGASTWYTNRLSFLKDLALVNPTYFASVPRIWIAAFNNIAANIRQRGKEKFFALVYSNSLCVMRSRRHKENRQLVFGNDEAPEVKSTFKNYFYHYLGKLTIYNTIAKKFGLNLIAGISGGGTLPEHIDDFFEIVGIKIVEGYGLTETSPILAVRSLKKIMPYTVGLPLSGTEIKICTEEGKELPNGEKGIIWACGPQVMNGYYKNPEKTNELMKTDAASKRWFNTGDLGIISKYGELVIAGRAKDTIVLIGGENVEPEPIENVLASCEFIEQIMVCGQDQEYLTALVVPKEQLLKKILKKLNIELPAMGLVDLGKEKKLKELFLDMIKEYINEKNGFREEEFIRNITFTLPFTPEDNTLTSTMKIKRHQVMLRDIARVRTMYPRFTEESKVKTKTG
ncbi:MAG: AMP-binding protein [Pseudomonadota bacterium]